MFRYLAGSLEMANQKPDISLTPEVDSFGRVMPKAQGVSLELSLTESKTLLFLSGRTWELLSQQFS